MFNQFNNQGMFSIAGTIPTYASNVKTVLGNDGTVKCDTWCPRQIPGSTCVSSYKTNTGKLLANHATNVVNGQKLGIISKCLPSKKQVPISDKNPICSSNLASNGGQYDTVYTVEKNNH